MIKKDLRAYAVAHWSALQASVTELSKDDDKHIPLIESAVELYNFDSICKTFFSGEKVPTSADSIDITPQSIRFIEFKTGFKKKITKQNFDKEKGRCEATQAFCSEYWNLFFKEQKKETKELIASIRFKALESYLVLEKQILPRCEDASKPIRVIFTAVIDAEAVESMVDTWAEVSGKRKARDTSIESVKSALERLVNLRDADGNVYCYDEIEVLSAQDYRNQLRQRL